MKIERYKIKDWEEEELGVFLDENEEWILVKSIPVDFQVDGYKLIKKEYIEERIADENPVLQKVLELKNLTFENPENFDFKSTIEFLKWVEEKYGCFEFQDEIEDELFYGILKEVNKESFYIDSITSKGTIDLDFDVEFSIKDVRVVSFGSDYFNSISLLYNYNKRKLS
ncbi:conserved protein of unknown function [Tenacibaculum sp. 190524A02b]|uniref:hypothetical protein n=1 Tax=Tenacibaculum vairaonense TaxID=3137860 RepID=UPI0032B1A33C